MQTKKLGWDAKTVGRRTPFRDECPRVWTTSERGELERCWVATMLGGRGAGRERCWPGTVLAATRFGRHEVQARTMGLVRGGLQPPSA